MTHLRVVRFRLNAANRSMDQQIGDDLVPAIKQQPGCSGAYFASNDDGECALVVLWDSTQQADAAASIISPKLMGHINGNIDGSADIHLLRILAD